jgi:RimJ/RimL family protein N-acetyltransferase
MDVARWPAAESLTSSRLDLEPLRVEHAGEMVTVLEDPELYEFTGGRPPSESELVERYTRQMVGASPDGRQGWLNWILRLRDSGTAVGTVQATLRDGDLDDRRAELAWVVSSGFQGAGYATEGATAVVEWLRGKGVESVEAFIHPAHGASAAVAHRLGLRPSGHTRGGETRWILRTRCHN